MDDLIKNLNYKKHGYNLETIKGEIYVYMTLWKDDSAKTILLRHGSFLEKEFREGCLRDLYKTVDEHYEKNHGLD